MRDPIIADFKLNLFQNNCCKNPHYTVHSQIWKYIQRLVEKQPVNEFI